MERNFCCRYEEIDTWNIENPNCSLKDKNISLIKFIDRKLTNLQGRVLVNSVIENFPFYTVVTDPSGRLSDDTGTDVELLKVLKEKLNFT